MTVIAARKAWSRFFIVVSSSFSISRWWVQKYKKFKLTHLRRKSSLQIPPVKVVNIFYLKSLRILMCITKLTHIKEKKFFDFATKKENVSIDSCWSDLGVNFHYEIIFKYKKKIMESVNLITCHLLNLFVNTK